MDKSRTNQCRLVRWLFHYEKQNQKTIIEPLKKKQLLEDLSKAMA